MTISKYTAGKETRRISPEEYLEQAEKIGSVIDDLNACEPDFRILHFLPPDSWIREDVTGRTSIGEAGLILKRYEQRLAESCIEIGRWRRDLERLERKYRTKVR